MPRTTRKPGVLPAWISVTPQEHLGFWNNSSGVEFTAEMIPDSSQCTILTKDDFIIDGVKIGDEGFYGRGDKVIFVRRSGGATRRRIPVSNIYTAYWDNR